MLSQTVLPGSRSELRRTAQERDDLMNKYDSYLPRTAFVAPGCATLTGRSGAAHAASVPQCVAGLLSKIYRALYGIDPIESDLREYLSDDTSLLDDLACYRIELERGRIGPQDLLDDEDFQA